MVRTMSPRTLRTVAQIFGGAQTIGDVYQSEAGPPGEGCVYEGAPSLGLLDTPDRQITLLLARLRKPFLLPGDFAHN